MAAEAPPKTNAAITKGRIPARMRGYSKKGTLNVSNTDRVSNSIQKIKKKANRK